MKGLEVRPSLSIRLFPLCVLGVLLASVQLATGSASDAPQGGPGRPTPPVSPSVDASGARRMRGLPLLRRAEQVRRLTPEQANLGYPVHLRAVVTYFNPGEGDLFVQDSSAGVWVDIGPAKLSLQPGQRVELEGVSEFLDFAPQVGQPRLRVLGEGKLPRPRRVSYENMISTQEDSQWVEVEGVIHSASSADGYLDLDLAMAGGRVKAHIPNFWRAVPARLVDARVRMRGVCGAEYNPGKQMVGVMVYVPSLAFVEVVEQPPADPYDLPLRSIGSLLRFSPQHRSGHRVRVQGVVTLARQGRSFIVQDKSDTAYVQTTQRVSVQPEDRVDVLGFPAVGQQAPMLLDAMVRTVGHEAMPRPALVTPGAALRGPYNGHLVRLEARLLDKVLGPGEQLLLLQADDRLFNAQLEDPRAVGKLSELPTQSLVQVTGICAVEEDEDRQPRAFRVLLRSAEDVVVLRRPPWLTLRGALLGLGVMAALISGALGWAVLLHRRVREQTGLIREQLRREAALKGQYRDLFEKANDIIYTLDLAGNLTSLNAAGEEATGYSRHEALRMNAAEIVAPELGARLAETLKRLQQGGPVPTEEWELITKDGRRLSVEVSTRLILEDGKPIGVQGIARDITERKRAEDQLRKLSRAVEQSPASVVITDVRGDIEYVNPKFTELTGYTLEEVVGKNPRLLKSGEHPVEMYEQLWQTITSGGEWRGEFHDKKKSGELYWESAVISAVRNAQGTITHFLAVKEDITERKRAEEAQSRLVAILDATSDFVGVATAEGHPVYLNKAGREMLRLGDDGPSVYSNLLEAHPEWARKIAQEQAIPGAIRDGVWSGEMALLTRDGHEVPVSQVFIAHKDAGGGVRYLTTIARDITERKRAEEELRRAKEAAEAANRAKSQFLASMSHEIRTPMNGIIGMTELALETELTPEQRDYLVMVKESADALLTIINDILDFSRIEAGKLGLDLSEFDLTELVGSTLKGLAVRAHQKGLELAFHIAPELPASLVGDAGRLRQVLVNLIGNAVKFTEQGEVALTVEAESPVDNAVLVRFCVADTGIGVPESQRKRIFEAFAQGDSSTTRKYGGTGLGLSISARLVEMMGGRIWVESEAGRGSAFNFTARLGLHAPQPPNDLPEGLASLRALPVLVVDDNATSRRMLAATLQHWGMQPTLAESGPAALAALARAKEVGNAFPCVGIDAQMPDMDGFMLAQRLLGIGDSGLGVGRNPNPEPQNPSQCGIIMMLTTTHQRDDSARCRELGITTYLVKPFLPRELLAALLAALGTPRDELSVSPSVDGLGGQRMAGVTPPSGDAPGADHRNLRVLVVEDSAVNRQLIVRLLEKRGHTSEIAVNGREALAILERAGLGSFDLVLMDVQMPEMDGFEATAAIREWEKACGTHLPIIALTAYALQGDLERCLAAGMDGYIPKPVRAGELFAAVEGLLGFAAEEAAGAQEGRRGRGRSTE